MGHDLLSKFNEMSQNLINRKNNVSLLYRATRDGFEASSFHARCDNRKPTLTIIKTTNGDIFGGYAEVSWRSIESYGGHDKNAFLFSLVNPINEPFVSKIKSPDCAIFCHPLCGPAFGSQYYNCDIFISDNSNLDETSHAGCFKSYQKPEVEKYYYECYYYFSRTKKFKVKEIEVFDFQS